MKRIVSDSLEATWQVAEQLGRELPPGSVLAFYGSLGAGKTCFVQGLAAGLGIDALVNSPTFTVCNEYHGRLPLYHMDLYRIGSEDEALNFGLDDYIYGQGITALEWSERVESLLPEHTLRITMTVGEHEDQRIICIENWNESHV